MTLADQLEDALGGLLLSVMKVANNKKNSEKIKDLAREAINVLRETRGDLKSGDCGVGERTMASIEGVFISGQQPTDTQEQIKTSQQPASKKTDKRTGNIDAK